MMGWIIIILLIIGAVYYANQDPNLINLDFSRNIQNITNLISYNNTPSSTIAITDDKTFFGKPFSYYNCINDESCKQTFGAGTYCEQNQISSYFGQCYKK